MLGALPELVGLGGGGGVEAAAFEGGFVKNWEGDASDGVGGRTSEAWELGSSLARIKGQIRSSWIVDFLSLLDMMPFTFCDAHRSSALWCRPRMSGVIAR